MSDLPPGIYLEGIDDPEMTMRRENYYRLLELADEILELTAVDIFEESLPKIFIWEDVKDQYPEEIREGVESHYRDCPRGETDD